MNVYKIEGMTCQSCAEKITRALQQSGYSEARVTLNPPELRINSSDAAVIQKIIARVGNYRLATSGHPKDVSHAVSSADPSDERLTPLFVILAYITGGVLLRGVLSDDYSLATLMTNFMGGFFVVFSLFKLLNLSGFVEAYATYDIIAKQFRVYGYAYPFLELGLGIAYFMEYQLMVVNSGTLILMAVGSIGVFNALRTKRRFQCACLGTALKLPMTKVTLVEDVGMGAMALIMLL